MRKFRSLTWLTLAAALAVTSCESNPYPQTGSIEDKARPPVKPIPVPYGLELPGVFVFRERETASYTINAWVPADGELKVEAFDLPPGAVFDAATLTLSWTPGPTDGNDPNDPTAEMRAYPVRFLLSNPKEPIVVIEKAGVIQVFNAPDPVPSPSPSPAPSFAPQSSDQNPEGFQS